MPLEKDHPEPTGFNPPVQNPPAPPKFNQDTPNKVANVLSAHPEAPTASPALLLGDETKINLPNLADIEKSYVADNKAIEQCEDEALETLFGRQITGNLQDPQNAPTLNKLNELIERFNTTSARLEKIERGCQLLSEGIIK